MVNRLQSSIFILIAFFTMGWGMAPIVRVAFGLDMQLTGSFIWSISFLIGGLMCGLTAMLLMVRRQPSIKRYLSTDKSHVDAAKMHACGLLLLTGIPLANFLVCYYLWTKNRIKSEYLDYVGREIICFQISIYLYLLMALFLAFIIVGALAIPVIILLHTCATIVAIITAMNGKVFHYPANISIIARAPEQP
jgi:uncharacterized Tic20 family protein